MALFSDLLPYILQQQGVALPGGPNLGPAIPRSPSNVTAMNMPSAKLPGAFDFANTANNFSNVMGENLLRGQQAHLSDLQAQHLAFQLKHLPEFWDQYTKTSGNLLTPGAGGSEQGGSLYQGSGTSGRLSPTGGGAGGDSGTYWTPEGLAALRPTEGRYDQIHYPSGNPSTATGAYGFLDSTWQEQAAKAGVDINQYPRAYLAPPEVQDMVAAQTPIHHWTGVDANGKPFNAAAQKLATNPAYVAGGRQTAAVPVTGGETITVPPGPTPAANAPWAPGDMSQYTRPGDKGRPVTVDGVTYPSTSAWNRAMDAQATATAGSAAMPVAPQGGAGIPEVPSYGGAMGETGATPPAAEDNDASLTPGEAGDESPGFAGRALTAKAASPREQLNEQIRARLGERQVAGEGAFGPAGATGNLLPGMNNLTGEVPALPGLDPALSMPFNPAAQQAAGPSPAVPTGGNVPTPAAPTPGGAGPAGMAQALAAAQAAMPRGQGAGFQLDPKQAEILKTIIMGNLVGMPNATKPLSEAFYNSPYFAEQKAAASARGAAQVGLQYAFPRKAAEEAAGYLGPGANPGLQGQITGARAAAPTQALFDAAMAAPEGSPLRNAYMAELLKQGGIKQFFGGERPGSPVWRINPQTFQPEMVATSPVPGHQVDSEGNKYAGFTTPPLPSTSLNPTGAPPKFQPVAMSEIGPGVAENLKTQAAEEQKVRQANIDAGGSSQQQQAALMTMKADVPNFYTGPWADKVQAAQSFMRLLPGGDRFVDQVASRESFDKNTGYLVREAVRATSPRAAVQEFKLIGGSLPNADMSPVGLNRVINELMGLNDYKIAKAQAQGLWEGRQGARTPTGDVTGFETDWQGKVSPYAFIVGRMDQGDRQKLFGQVGKTKEGQAEIQHLMEQVKYIQDSGLHQFLR